MAHNFSNLVDVAIQNWMSVQAWMNGSTGYNLNSDRILCSLELAGYLCNCKVLHLTCYQSLFLDFHSRASVETANLCSLRMLATFFYSPKCTCIFPDIEAKSFTEMRT